MLLGLLCSTLILSGCSNIHAKFLKTETFNLAPFAKQTTEMVHTLHYDVSDRQMLYLRGMRNFIGEKQVATYIALNHEVELLLKSIVAYSIGVVEISEKKISAHKKNQALAYMIFRLSDHISEKGMTSFTSPEIKTLIQTNLAKIKASETYLEGLRNAQPLINEINSYALHTLDALDQEQTRLVAIFDQAIDDRFKVHNNFLDVLRDTETRHYTALTLLSHYRDTHDPELIKQIRALNLYSIDPSLSRKNSLNQKDLLKMYEELSTSLNKLERNRDQLRPMITRYYKSRLELNKLLKDRRSAIKNARLSFMLWSKAHAKMSNGRMKPAEWYDVNETIGMLFGAAQRAAHLK